MSQIPSDTLNIQPINPHSRAVSHEPNLDHRPDEPSSENDPDSAAAARARIEELHQPSGAFAAPTPADQDDLPLNQPPISPAREHFKPRAAAAIPLIANKVHDITRHRSNNQPSPEAVKAAEPKASTAQRRKFSHRLPSRAKPVISAVASFLLILAVLKSPVLFTQIGYLLGDKPSVNEQIGQVLPAAGGTAVSSVPLLTIPKINVKAPVVFEPSIEESHIQKALEGGVVHYGNTALPGQSGNTVIFGHSSNDWWEPGNYKFVFVLLDKLAIGDTFSLDYNQTKYIYEVTSIRTVRPTELSVLAGTAEPTATLITCTPPGWSTNRLVINAKQTSPTAGQAAPVSQPAPKLTDKNVLPGSAPSFTEQIGQGWKAFTETVFGKS